MQRIWSGLSMSPFASRTAEVSEKAVLTVCCFNYNANTLIITLCADSKIRFWSTATQTCIYTKEIQVQRWDFEINRSSYAVYEHIRVNVHTSSETANETIRKPIETHRIYYSGGLVHERRKSVSHLSRCMAKGSS